MVFSGPKKCVSQGLLYFKVYLPTCYTYIYSSYYDYVFYFTADFPKVFQKNGEERIVNGFDTEKALPYQLSILVDVNNYKKQHICGATLLTSKFAISAIHCFVIEDRSNVPWRKVRPLQYFQIVAGRYNQNLSSTNFGEKVSNNSLTDHKVLNSFILISRRAKYSMFIPHFSKNLWYR